MVAVLDTNILVSALLNASGAPAKVRKRWRKRQFEVLVSPPILDEYLDVLKCIPAISPAEALSLIAELRAFTGFVTIKETLRICKNPDDDKFLETAVMGGADFLVIKNLKHFPRKSYKNVRIANVAAFLTDFLLTPSRGHSSPTLSSRG